MNLWLSARQVRDGEMVYSGIATRWWRQLCWPAIPTHPTCILHPLLVRILHTGPESRQIEQRGSILVEYWFARAVVKSCHAASHGVFPACTD
jgi:hypothetical protein